MNNKKSQYPQMTYKQAVEHCKYWADQIRHDGLDLLTTDYGAAIYAIRYYADVVDRDHTDRSSWEKLLELIDRLASIYQ